MSDGQHDLSGGHAWHGFAHSCLNCFMPFAEWQKTGKACTKPYAHRSELPPEVPRDTCRYCGGQFRAALAIHESNCELRPAR